jgi:hypothetical protein
MVEPGLSIHAGSPASVQADFEISRDYGWVFDKQGIERVAKFNKTWKYILFPML